ncbi:MAG: sigma-54 dependent transcriptional regulator [Calditrichia bacterium]
MGVLYLDSMTEENLFGDGEIYLYQILTDFISPIARRVLEQKKIDENDETTEEDLRRNFKFDAVVGHHPGIIRALKIVSKTAATDANILIEGESGTGKDLFARVIHENSMRFRSPFVPINCAAIPETLLESELFGYTKGAFTGANKDKAGWFERADGGTIFLDEVHEMPLSLQVKLLRVLQSGEYSPVGSTQIQHADVRIIAATTRKLTDLIKENRFREELFYRLNVIDIYLLPLRYRKMDIPELIRHFLRRFEDKYSRKGLKFSREAEAVLFNYNFPGNIRELENIIERAVLLCEGKTIQVIQLPLVSAADGSGNFPLPVRKPFTSAKKQIVEKFESEYIKDCLEAKSGNISRAAELAGMNIKNFYEKMTKYEINPGEFKNK